MLRFLWSVWRGAYRTCDYYTPCERCGFIGRVHLTGCGPCWRYKRPRSKGQK